MVLLWVHKNERDSNVLKFYLLKNLWPNNVVSDPTATDDESCSWTSNNIDSDCDSDSDYSCSSFCASDTDSINAKKLLDFRKKTSRLSIAKTDGTNKKISEKCLEKLITPKQNEQKCFDQQKGNTSSDWKEIMNRNVSHKYSYIWY